MPRRTSSFTLSQVKPSRAEAAFSFYEKAASAHIWPRTLPEIRDYCESGQLFGITDDSTGQLVGVCYAVLDEREQAWEVGGLLVNKDLRRAGLGKFLLQMALAHTIAFQEPLKYGQRIIAHVHEANDKPRGLFEELDFEYSKQVKVPPEVAPASMARNKEGEIVGDEFEFREKGLKQLSRWLNEEFNSTLGPDVVVNVYLGNAAYMSVLKQTIAAIANSA